MATRYKTSNNKFIDIKTEPLIKTKQIFSDALLLPNFITTLFVFNCAVFNSHSNLVRGRRHHMALLLQLVQVHSKPLTPHITLHSVLDTTIPSIKAGSHPSNIPPLSPTLSHLMSQSQAGSWR